VNAKGLIGGSIVCAVFLFAVAHMILPEHCQLFSSNFADGLMCDGFDINNPQPCPVRRDKGMAAVARIFAGLGVFILFIPLVVYFLRIGSNGEPT
jgi:hypothetical protein